MGRELRAPDPTARLSSAMLWNEGQHDLSQKWTTLYSEDRCRQAPPKSRQTDFPVQTHQTESAEKCGSHSGFKSHYHIKWRTKSLLYPP